MPIAAPIAMATAMSAASGAPIAAAAQRESQMVATRAMPMPTMPKALPSLAVSCFESPARRDDEEHRGDDVCRLDQVSGDVVIAAQSFRNIWSMRPVTAKPPKMLMLATSDADEGERPDHRQRCRCRAGAAPPTTMMPLIALVSDMSGVCRAWATLEMT